MSNRFMRIGGSTLIHFILCRLFVYNEYSVYRTLVVWLFLQINPEVQLLPSHSTVTAFFNR